MIYILIGEDKYLKELEYNNIKVKTLDCESKTFHIKSQKEFQLLENDIELFLITNTFFHNRKIAKLNCSQEIDILSIVKGFLDIVNEDSIIVIFIDKIELKIKKKLQNMNLIQIMNFDNISNKNEAYNFTKNLLVNSNLKFEKDEDIEIISNSIVLASQKEGIKNIYDRSLIYLEIDKLSTLYDGKIIRYKDIKLLYKKSFDGNFFKLVDQIFYKDNIKDVIDLFEEFIDSFTIDEIKTLLNILLYTLKEYLKYTNNSKTNKYFLFKKSKIRIKDINNFIIYTSELSLKVKLTNKFNKEELYIIFLKFIDFNKN